jgi:hypothetical protein
VEWLDHNEPNVELFFVSRLLREQAGQESGYEKEFKKVKQGVSFRK